ncbi:MAG: RND family transporter, partial [Haloplanus sp.]
MTDIGRRVRDGLEAVGRRSASHPRPVVAVVLVLVVLSGGVAATSLQMQMGMTLYIDDESETAEEWAMLKDDFETGNNVFVVVKSDTLYDPETIRAIDRLDRGYTGLDETSRVTSLADLVRAGNGGKIPETETGVRRALDRATADPSGEQLYEQVVPETGTTIILVSYGDVGTFDRGSLLPTSGAAIVTEEVRQETRLAALP